MEFAKSLTAYFTQQEIWKEELHELRYILNTTELEEKLKWGFPTYTLKNKNVVGLAAFKDYVGLWFFNGVFLNDEAKKLVNAQQGKTKAMRQWRFTSLQEIIDNQSLILAYIQEAIENQKQGKEVKPIRNKKPLIIPSQLQQAFQKDPILAQCFDALNLTKKREYAEYINDAKQTATKERRLGKITPMIKLGLGLWDKYKK